MDVVSDTWDDGRPQREEVTPDPVDSPASPASVESVHVSEVPDSDSEVSDPMGTSSVKWAIHMVHWISA